ncbi:MAG TPA: LD-carboxypeptidase [Candidatus Sulfotelmatobacter sp.]|jgi:muramoyltetrapeptide carboxypeptidase|nr:LD-carboxypeptidase [Candidatus Sulfotelmatobacter sp.]
MTASMTRAEHRDSFAAVKPRALAKGARVAVFASASPAEENRIARGLHELRSLGFSPEAKFARESQGYFAASAESRFQDFVSMLNDSNIAALFALRGGYGSNYLLDDLWNQPPSSPKCLVGYSDVTSLQILLWQKLRWVTFYGPMAAAGLDAGANAARGYDKPSLEAAFLGSPSPWNLALNGEAMTLGVTEGVVLGGCLTLIETALATPWELDTAGSILLLEDRGMKPWQIDRALMHLTQAGKFRGVKAIVLGEFPDCEPPVAGSPSAKDVCERILKPLGVPIVFGAAVGHTPRPMLTIPLGIRARLVAEGSGTLEFLESTVIP